MQKRAITDAIRRAIEFAKRRGVSRYRLAQETGISEPALCGFMKRRHDLSLDAVDRLAPLLGLRLVVDVQRRARKRGRNS